ncbi:hypothetical protein V1517DRAFT_316814, partial [Lipomyces orientalis]
IEAISRYLFFFFSLILSFLFVRFIQICDRALLTMVHRYPQLWYDRLKGEAMAVAPPTLFHSRMAGALLSSICDEVKM